MGEKTGRPRGRPPGAKNRRTREREDAIAAAEERLKAMLGPDMFDGDAHAFLMSVYKDPAVDLERRLDAAKAAIRFEKPALAATELKGELVITDVSADPEPSEAEWAEQHGHA